MSDTNALPLMMAKTKMENERFFSRVLNFEREGRGEREKMMSVIGRERFCFFW